MLALVSEAHAASPEKKHFLLRLAPKKSSQELQRALAGLEVKVDQPLPQKDFFVLAWVPNPKIQMDLCQLIQTRTPGLTASCKASEKLTPQTANCQEPTPPIIPLEITETLAALGAQCLPSRHSNDRTMEAPGLTSDWAQEYVGADLAKDFLASLRTQYAVRVGVFDFGFRPGQMSVSPQADQRLLEVHNEYRQGPESPRHSHGLFVGNIITGPGHYSVTGNPPVSLSTLREVDRSHDLPYSIGDMLRNPNPPQVLNFSIGNFGTASGLKAISESGIVAVVASGNSFAQFGGRSPDGTGDPAVREVGNDIVIVGSLSPLGYPSYNSEANEHVSILAPSDEMITVSTDRGGLSLQAFSGTSGAAPVVTGSIANAQAILPGLTPRQYRRLVEGSALQLPNSFQTPRRNGSGMLNSLKLLHVTKKLRDTCGMPADAPCVERSLADANFFSLAANAARRGEVLAAVAQAFPDCAGNADTPRPRPNPSCDDRQALVKELRELTLLDQSFGAGWDQLACIYSSAGFPLNASFYRQAKNPQQMVVSAESVTSNLIKTGNLYASALRGYAALGDEVGLKRVLEIVTADRGAFRRYPIRQLQAYAKREWSAGAQVYLGNRLLSVEGLNGDVQLAYEILIAADPDAVFNQLSELLRNRPTAMTSGQIFALDDLGLRGLELLQVCLQSCTDEMKRFARVALGIAARELGRLGADGIPLILAYTDFSDELSRRAAIQQLIYIGAPAEDVLIEKFFSNETDSTWISENWSRPSSYPFRKFSPSFNLLIIKRSWERDQDRMALINHAGTILGLNAIPWLLEVRVSSPEFAGRIDEQIARLSRLPTMP